MAVSDTLVKEIAVRLAARRPSTNTLVSPTGRPGGDMGADITDAVRALIEVECRADERYKQAIVSIPKEDLEDTEDYTVTIDGVDYTVAASGTTQTSVNNLLTAIAAAITAGTIATATYSTVTEVMTIVSDDADDHVFAVSTTAATDLTLAYDSVQATFTVYLGRETATDVWRWHVPLGGMAIATAGLGHNWAERIDCAGYTRAWVDVEAADGRTVVRVSPCILE